MNQAPAPTFYFHDYESFGIHPGRDRPAQFAGIRTDAELNPIGEPLMIYCRMPLDYLPDPEACLITGITPQQVNRDGLCEADFMGRIHQEFSHPQTCILGYNNVRFDDEFTRYGFYRNYIDPYAYSWQNGNSRWDLLDVVRACFALRPEGIEWVYDDEGKPSFKLERLTVANGIGHQHAHDALSDVYATIGIARLIRERQPKLFHYLFDLRSKQRVKALIDIPGMKPLVHVSGMFPATQGCASWVLPMAWHPDNPNAVIVVDLARDVTPLIDLDVDELRQRLYIRREELADLAPIPLKLVHINKCPVLAPAATLTEQRADELGIDRKQCRSSLNLLRQHPELQEKLRAVFSQPRPVPPEDEAAELQLYAGFIEQADRQTMMLVRETAPELLSSRPFLFNDARLQAMLFNYRARNYPHTLSSEEVRRWQRHCSDYINQHAEQYVLKLELLLEQHAQDSRKVTLLRTLAHYLQTL
ncbi:exodeoxyribonuclease I [Pseudaeromonas sharmana]|uniref:Exodeoxyribonuclease I n=1 Tax=Pseudaeromonas sharmana TaxID=328412 RepID=A0ABV8CPQ7_9GAMM